MVTGVLENFGNEIKQPSSRPNLLAPERPIRMDLPGFLLEVESRNPFAELEDAITNRRANQYPSVRN